MAGWHLVQVKDHAQSVYVASLCRRCIPVAARMQRWQFSRRTSRRNLGLIWAAILFWNSITISVEVKPGAWVGGDVELGHFSARVLVRPMIPPLLAE